LTRHENIEACIVQQKSEAVVVLVDHPSFAGVKQTVLQKHRGSTGAGYAVHGQDVSVGSDNIVRFGRVAFFRDEFLYRREAIGIWACDTSATLRGDEQQVRTQQQSRTNHFVFIAVLISFTL
jgi:hypothetical protein